MVEPLSPLGPAFRPGRHGNIVGQPAVTLTEMQPGSIVQVAAWPGREADLRAALAAVTGLSFSDTPGAGAVGDSAAVFGIGLGRFLAVDDPEDLGARLTAAITADTGTVTDLTHGRTAIRIRGPRAEWVLSKFFAVDFARPTFPIGYGRSTVHHDVFAAIQRSGEDRFDLYVFRSFARSFWTMLCHGAEEVGYEVI